MNIEKQNQQKMDNLIIKEFILTVVAVFLIVGAVAFVIKNARLEQPKPAVVQDVQKPLTQQEQEQQNQRRLTTAIILMAG